MIVTNLVFASQLCHVEGINPRSVEVILRPHFLPERCQYDKLVSNVNIVHVTSDPSYSSLLSWHFQNCEALKTHPRGGASLEGQECLEDNVISLLLQDHVIMS